jgi:hypothetical protein
MDLAKNGHIATVQVNSEVWYSDLPVADNPLTVRRGVVSDDARVLPRVSAEPIEKADPLARDEPEQDPGVSILDQLPRDERGQGDCLLGQCVCSRSKLLPDQT